MSLSNKVEWQPLVPPRVMRWNYQKKSHPTIHGCQTLWFGYEWINGASVWSTMSENQTSNTGLTSKGQTQEATILLSVMGIVKILQLYSCYHLYILYVHTAKRTMKISCNRRLQAQQKRSAQVSSINELKFTIKLTNNQMMLAGTLLVRSWTFAVCISHPFTMTM